MRSTSTVGSSSGSRIPIERRRSGPVVVVGGDLVLVEDPAQNHASDAGWRR